jgi:hypothetical protein
LAPDAGTVHATDWVHLKHVGFFIRKKHSWVLRDEGVRGFCWEVNGVV